MLILYAFDVRPRMEKIFFVYKIILRQANRRRSSERRQKAERAKTQATIFGIKEAIRHLPTQNRSEREMEKII
jgi:hypothetical protein